MKYPQQFALLRVLLYDRRDMRAAVKVRKEPR